MAAIDDKGELVRPNGAGHAATTPPASTTTTTSPQATAPAQTPATPSAQAVAEPDLDLSVPTEKANGKGWIVPEGWEGMRTSSAPAIEAAPGQTGLVLYVDCFPEKGFHKDHHARLEDLLSPVMAAVAKQLDVPHYSLAGYNDGPKAIAAMVSGNLAKLLKKYPTIVCMTRFSTTNPVLEMLLPHADVVIRGR
jgi:hypothetical protein